MITKSAAEAQVYHAMASNSNSQVSTRRRKIAHSLFFLLGATATTPEEVEP